MKSSYNGIPFTGFPSVIEVVMKIANIARINNELVEL